MIRNTNMDFPELLIAARGDRSQGAVADAAGISASYLCDLEKGRRIPSGSVTSALVAALELSGDDALDLVDAIRAAHLSALGMGDERRPTINIYRRNRGKTTEQERRRAQSASDRTHRDGTPGDAPTSGAVEEPSQARGSGRDSTG